MANQVFKEGNRIGEEKVRVHRGGNRIDGVSHDLETFYNDLPVPKRSKIPMSFDRKLSFNMGQLIPILCQECVPGDTFHIAQAHNIMFAPLVAPLYQRIDYRTWYFFVPTRLVDDGWKDFITMKDPTYVLPTFNGSTVRNSFASQANWKNTLMDYFDLPVQETNFFWNEQPIICHPFRAYNLIYNEYFRDEFKQPEIRLWKDGGAKTGSNAEIKTYVPKNIGWEKDYFTTCQTVPQMGSDVPLPSGDIVPDGQFTFLDEQSVSAPARRGNASQNNTDFLNITSSGSNNSKLNYSSGLKIDNTVSATINELRMANHLQELRDKLKIAGARYNEAILAEYGIVVPDYRIQRPEYIGGYAQPVEIGRVMQNTPTTGVGGTPLGSYAGSASGSGRMDYIHYQALEHGYIIGLCCVVPRTAYDQGIPRQLIKRDYYDYYHPDLATLGDQQVLNDEIFVSDNRSTGVPDTSRFGYTQRYQDYKMNCDRINGEFRDNLSFWHMARQFQSLPALNGSFVEADPTDRIFAVQSLANNIYAEIYQQIDSVRPMPVSVQPNLTNVE